MRRQLFERLQKLSQNSEARLSPSLGQLLEKYFGDYDPGNEQAFYDNQKLFQGDLDAVGSNVFGGIKLYPPLGFDPWPNYDNVPLDKNLALKKVKLLYQTCEEKGIPITVHTSSGGFESMPAELHALFTSPERWRSVLQQYPRLKINFAHCGVQNGDMTSAHDWKQIIFEDFILSGNHPNVYSDVSDLLSNREDYGKFKSGMAALQLNKEEQEAVGKRLLFGTDFMVSLRGGQSYREYLDLFATDTSVFKTWWHKQNLIHDNPRRFLFG